ncbi:hypothetical protein K402DRAFT_419628 [Aulographum hederae CBS 113979]|uniref:VOC domain-containing protein n=1 Tax=Aulographum hederae CBS 113979 TaxID=1176131 RepID=A0A6G1H5J1_9PEZI|nr:hypothetical protein K402DRAFT_419628 [Aulographum hederae CBS 113979]
MPLSTISLTVSHLPSSCSFYLSALQPLGYRYIGQDCDQIVLGIDHPELFLRQHTSGFNLAPTNLTFSAPSRIAVREFYTAALQAGGLPHGSPAYRDLACGWFNAAVLDADGNSIEALHCERAESDMSYASDPLGSRVLTWQRSVADNATRSVVAPSAKSRVSAASTSAKSAKSGVSNTLKSSRPGLSLSIPVAANEVPSKTVIGTLLGAAAGAAVAYAMCQSEHEGGIAGQTAYGSWQVPKQMFEPPPPGSDPNYESAHRFLQRAIEIAPAIHQRIADIKSMEIPEAPQPKSIEAPKAPTAEYVEVVEHRSRAPSRVSHKSSHRSRAASAPRPRTEIIITEERAVPASAHTHRSGRTRAATEINVNGDPRGSRSVSSLQPPFEGSYSASAGSVGGSGE